MEMRTGEEAGKGLDFADGREDRPTSAEVLRELLALRTYSGVSRARILEDAPRLQELDATLDHMAWRQLEAHAAAFEVLQCAVHRAVERTDFRQVLLTTLNLKAKRERSTLSDREIDAAAEVGLELKALRNLMKEAYGELAVVLVSLRVSPCRQSSESPDEPGFDAVRQLLMRALHIMSTSSAARLSGTIAYDEARHALRALPNVVRGLPSSDNQYEDPVSRLHDVLASIPPEHWLGPNETEHAPAILRLFDYTAGDPSQRYRTFLSERFSYEHPSEPELHSADRYIDNRTVELVDAVVAAEFELGVKTRAKPRISRQPRPRARTETTLRADTD